MSTEEWRGRYEEDGCVDLWVQEEFNAGSRLVVCAVGITSVGSMRGLLCKNAVHIMEEAGMVGVDAVASWEAKTPAQQPCMHAPMWVGSIGSAAEAAMVSRSAGVPCPRLGTHAPPPWHA